MTNIRLLALDLDGTLLGADSRVPQENARAVRLAQEAGVQVALCTGRNHTEVLTFNSQLEQSADWAVIANGAAVVDLHSGAMTPVGGLNREDCALVRQLSQSFGVDACFYTATPSWSSCGRRGGAAGSPWTRRQRATSLCPTARAGMRCFAGRKETWSRRSCTTSTRRWWTR